jgi:RNA polymerase sigma factor (sigma-70 family)
LTDGQLLERFVAHRDEGAFTVLVMRHGPMVLGVCRAVLNDSPEVEDAFQATFLVFIRRAVTIRGRDAVGGWLHRVAHRVAVQASLDRSRKNLLIRQVDDLSTLVAVGEAPSDIDWHAPLHEEVARLPGRFRLPVVLCYLEGKTHAQAAVELRWSEATVRRRLADARELLRSRLTRRGVTVSSGALLAILGSEASAAVPASWVDALSQVAVRLRAGEIAIRGTVSTMVARLAETLVRSMIVRQIQALGTVLLLLVAASLVAPHLLPAGPAKAGAAGAARLARPADPLPSPSSPASSPWAERPADSTEPARTLTIRGRVLDPDGKTFAGAKVYSYRSNPRDDAFFSAGPPSPDAISGADGRFQFQIAAPELATLQGEANWSSPTIVTLARGFGPAWTSFTKVDQAKDLTLKLVRDDVPIVGRVIDLEGRPIPGVTVGPLGLWASPEQDLSAWEAATAGAKDIYDGAMDKLPESLELFRWRNDLAVKTGADGRFRLTGIGRERVVSLSIEGSTIVTSFGNIHARTRPGPTYRLAEQRDKPEFGTLVFHGATFDHAAAPTRPIEGTVRDKDTGHPLAGVSIQSDRFAGNIISGMSYVWTTTDAQGRYRLVGMPGGSGNAITASPEPAQPYLGASAEVSAGSGPAPAVVDFALKHGVAIRGKVINKMTGKPVPATVEYFLFVDNPHRDEARRLHGGAFPTRPDGSFELVGLPGRGLVTARAAKDRFLIGQGAETIPGADHHGWFQTDPHICQPEFTHAIAAIDPAEGATSLTCGLALDPGTTRPGTVLGPDGKPLAGCVAINLGPGTISQDTVTLASESFTAIALDPKQSRALFFRHDGQKLAAVVMARGDENTPLVVRLQPYGTVTGRLIDDDGRPRTGVIINVMFGQGKFGPGYYWPTLSPTLGGDGRFRIEGLIPGVSYNLGLRVGGATFLGDFAKGLTLQPGETRDLGDVRTQPR